MSTFFDQQSTYPKPYLTNGINISSNQDYFYLNEKLDTEKKITEQINELASNVEKINDEIREVICNHHQLKDTVHQNHKEALFKLNQQARYNRNLSKQIYLSKTDHTFIKTQLDNLKGNSQKFSEEMSQLESGITHRIDKFTHEQQLFRDQHEMERSLFTDQLNSQQERVQNLSEVISQTKSEISLPLESIEKLANKMKRMVREHQMLKVIVDSSILLQNNINQEFKKHLSQCHSNSSEMPVQAENEVHILSKQFTTNFETIEEVKQQLGKTEQLPVENELIQYPFALFLNILPSNYPAQSIFVNGKQERVTAFLSVNNQEKVALFLEDEKVKKYDYRIIEGITLGEEW